MMNIRSTLATVFTALVVTASPSVEAAARVHYRVHRELQATGAANIVAVMKTKPTEAYTTHESATFATRGEKIASLVNALESIAKDSQQIIDTLLVEEAATSQTLFASHYVSWSSNARYFNGATFALVEKLSALDGVELIREQEMASIDETQRVAARSLPLTADANAVQWNINHVGAPKVWARGFTGQGIVVGSIDSGVRYTHEILQNNMREDYNWYDPSNQTSLPYDHYGHGTHVMGILAGANGYGVAPGAKWITCLGCPSAICPEWVLVSCGEWMTCPSDSKGKNRDCSKAPHVVNNSWGRKRDQDFFHAVVDAWQAAGIIPVFGNGNFGPKCNTTGSPGNYANVIGVGAVDSNGTLSDDSGRGPAISGILKPDLTAPGVDVQSAWRFTDTTYLKVSGTSMAAPHVTGAIALLLSAERTLTYADVYARLASTTDQKPAGATSKTTCSGIRETVFPNYHYGYGRIDVFSASVGHRT